MLDEENSMVKGSFEEAIEAKAELENSLQTLTFKVSEMERDLIDAKKERQLHPHP